jgi:putative PIN family toxin of toxin-antitoxin system
LTSAHLRVVVDPNVFVSAAISPAGMPGQLVRSGFGGRFRFVVCSHLVRELDRVLQRSSFRRYLSLEDVRELVETVEDVADVEPDPEAVVQVSRDPDDDLLALAIAAGADLVVTVMPTYSTSAIQQSRSSRHASCLTGSTVLDRAARSHRAPSGASLQVLRGRRFVSHSGARRGAVEGSP